jgi:hypothetical protein
MPAGCVASDPQAKGRFPQLFAGDCALFTDALLLRENANETLAAILCRLQPGAEFLNGGEQSGRNAPQRQDYQRVVLRQSGHRCISTSTG